MSNRAQCPTCGQDTYTEGLSKREQDVLDLLVTGLRQVSIGVELGMSQKTVSVHLDNIRKRLKLSGSFDLARWELARRHELLEAELRGAHPKRMKALAAFVAYAGGR